MWISELSEQSGIPVDTIKHYLRIGVLPKGRSVGPLRAEYDDTHVDRLRLVKALTEIGELKLDQVRRIFDEVGESPVSIGEAVATAHYELSRRTLEGREPSARSLRIVDEMTDRLRWRIGPGSTHRLALAVTLDALESVHVTNRLPGQRIEDALELYASHLDVVAREEIRFVDVDSPDTAVLHVVAGTVLSEPLLLLVRRLAQENAVHEGDARPLDPAPPEVPRVSPPGRRWTDPGA